VHFIGSLGVLTAIINSHQRQPRLPWPAAKLREPFRSNYKKSAAAFLRRRIKFDGDLSALVEICLARRNFMWREGGRESFGVAAPWKKYERVDRVLCCTLLRGVISCEGIQKSWFCTGVSNRVQFFKFSAKGAEG
jgi:hypothetical protein